MNQSTSSLEMGARDLTAAEKELSWYHADAAAAVGFHASGLEAGGDHVFDAEAAHVTRRSWRHQRAATMLRRIEACLGQLALGDRRVVELAYTPHGWESQMREFFTLRGRGVCLAALATTTAAALALRDSWWAASPQKRHKSVAEFLESETLLGVSCRKARSRLSMVRAEAAGILTSSLQCYDSIRLERVDWERSMRKEYVAKEWWQ